LLDLSVKVHGPISLSKDVLREEGTPWLIKRPGECKLNNVRHFNTLHIFCSSSPTSSFFFYYYLSLCLISGITICWFKKANKQIIKLAQVQFLIPISHSKNPQPLEKSTIDPLDAYLISQFKTTAMSVAKKFYGPVCFQYSGQ
jgi:hypothetical protein